MREPDRFAVLLVHRADPTGEHLAQLLSQDPFDLTWVYDGEQGLRQLQQGDLHAVVYEGCPQRVPLVRLLESGRVCDLKPVQLVVVGQLRVEDLVALVRAGADDLISTESAGTLLRERLWELLQRRSVEVAPGAQSPPTASRRRGRPAEPASPLDRMVGRSAAIAEVKRQLTQLAQTRSAVLFTGETGTGKTLAAEILHQISPRAEKPFRRVYCPALSRTLVESELFGYVKGAFTDAKQSRAGILESAQGGTVLLEEVGDLPKATQSSILRFLETGEIRRIGSGRMIRLDVRVLVCTAEPLEELAARGNIRKNLLYRLEGVQIHLPPLRERREDVQDLIRFFVPRLCGALNRPIPRITRRALQRLASFDWPGNIRQLIHTLEGILATTPGDVIDLADIPLHLRGQVSSVEALKIPLGSSLAGAEKTIISETLKMLQGNKVRAAKILGIGLRTLYRKMKLYGI